MMDLRPKEPMTSKIKENKAFADCFRDWIAVVQRNHTSVERTLPENRASADGQERADGARLFGTKLSPGSCGFVA